MSWHRKQWLEAAAVAAAAAFGIPAVGEAMGGLLGGAAAGTAAGAAGDAAAAAGAGGIAGGMEGLSAVPGVFGPTAAQASLLGGSQAIPTIGEMAGGIAPEMGAGGIPGGVSGLFGSSSAPVAAADTSIPALGGSLDNASPSLLARMGRIANNPFMPKLLDALGQATSPQPTPMMPSGPRPSAGAPQPMPSPFSGNLGIPGIPQGQTQQALSGAAGGPLDPQQLAIMTPLQRQQYLAQFGGYA